MMQKFTLATALALGALGVIIGAFGAHALKPLLESSGRLDTFETGVRYHFYHALFMLAIGLLMSHIRHPLLNYASLSALIGVILFSGSIYTLCLSGITKFAIVTPIGGLFLIGAWLLALISIIKS
ncbi:DUF423 domain-containing protein [Fulvitalea axinellae]|uniref:DUF423 domain-containing protein n=1 Tax=Fulvitalea axinellae TaxID=1182444 RepID=A0AAU9CG51_9BACT|nr:DUF423 domain-containing protein [Fulvitalea axinellae]